MSFNSSRGSPDGLIPTDVQAGFTTELIMNANNMSTGAKRLLHWIARAGKAS
jgi:hypothetical protein